MDALTDCRMESPMDSHTGNCMDGPMDSHTGNCLDSPMSGSMISPMNSCLTPERGRYLCLHWQSVSGLPIRLYRTDEAEPKLIANMPEEDTNADPVRRHLPTLLAQPHPVSFLFTPQMIGYGIVRFSSEPIVFIIGPAHRTRITGLLAAEVLREAGIEPPHRAASEGMLMRITPCDFEHFVPLLCLIDCQVNGAMRTMEDVVRWSSSNAASTSNAAQDRSVQENHTLSLAEAQEEQRSHHDMAYERRMLNCIRLGNMQALRGLAIEPLPGHTGRLAKDEIRQHRNTFITLITLVTRASISGGLDSETALFLSDTYIQQVETLQRAEGIRLLTIQMMLDFTRRVADRCKDPKWSPAISACASFIRMNANRSLSVAEIAAHAGLSVSHLSRRFHAETGRSIARHVLLVKVDEAKNLLACTDRPLSEISNFLGFSSQSHFQNVFRKETGQTPAAWRRAQDGSWIAPDA